MLANSGRSCTLLAITALGFTSVWLCLNIVSTFHVDITSHNAVITENDRLESLALRLAMARHVVNTSITSSVINCTLKRQPQQQLYSVRQQFLVADRHTTNMTLTSGPSLLGYRDFILPVIKLCQAANHKPAKLVVIGVIFSAPKHTNRRQTIRDTWGSVQSRQHADIVFGIIFILGLSPDSDTLRTRAIMEESAKYNDILLKDFTDSHQNLSLKSCSALEWVSRHCPAAQYVAKIDDDVFVNTYVLLDYLSVLRRQFAMATARSTAAAAAAAATLTSSSSVIAASPTSSTPSSILCFVHAADKVPGGLLKTWGDVGRRKSSDGTDGNYPPFCAGPAYVVERQAVTALYAGCRCAKYFPYEDVLITGILAREAAVRLSPLSQYYLLGQQQGRWAEEMLRNNDRGGEGGRRMMAGGNRPRKHAYMFCHMAGVKHTDDSVWRQLWTNITHMRTA